MGLDGPDAGIAHRPPRCALPPGLQDEPAALHTEGSTWLSDPHFALSERVCMHVLTGAADGGESTWGSGVFHRPAGGGQGAGVVSQGPQPELCSAGWVRWGTFMCRREALPGGGVGTRHHFAGSCCSSQGFEGRWWVPHTRPVPPRTRHTARQQAALCPSAGMPTPPCPSGRVPPVLQGPA